MANNAQVTHVWEALGSITSTKNKNKTLNFGLVEWLKW
jgi:hypothetical protein